MTHREAIKAWLAEINLKSCLVIDWGSGAKPVSRYLQHDDCEFITIDKNPLIAGDRRSPAHITTDIQQPITVNTADVAFCIEVLEHTLRPDNVITNIFNNLKPNGKLYLSVPFMFRIHSDDDYFRFTENGLKALLGNFSDVTIRPTVGDEGYLVEATK